MKTVNVVGAGTEDDPRRPDLPEGTPFRVVADNGDTMGVEVAQLDRIAALEARLDAVSALAEKANATATEVAAAAKGRA